MSDVALAPRAHALLSRLDSWAERDAGRAMLVRITVTVAGPLVMLAGVAMLVLPGPGLVVIAGGLALLALEYEWARRALGFLGHTLSKAREATIPKQSTGARKAVGAVVIAALAVAGFLATAAVTAFLGAHTVL